jgi:peptide/nickel transport system substrate-binding protein
MTMPSANFRKMSKLKTVILLTAAIPLLSILFLFCTGEPNENDVLNIGYNGYIDDFDQYSSTLRTVLNLGYLIWDPIVLRDPNSGSILPHLAESWTVLDPTKWEFKLKENIKFHNGNPLNAEAVRYTVMERILSAVDSPRKVNFQWIKEIKVIDEHTFHIITHEPYPLVLERLNTLFPYDPIECREKGDDYIRLHPTGTGPYILKNYDKNSKIELIANSNYWMEGVPKIKNLNLWLLPDSSKRLQDLLEGKLDVALNLNPDALSTLENAKYYIPMNVPVLRISFWQFDSLGRAGETPLVKKKVRQAIYHAIDRKSIVENIFHNQVGFLDSPLHPLQFGFDPDSKGLSYDPEKARTLLEEAGYPEGFTIDLWEYFDEQHVFNTEAVKYLQEVGIRVVLHDYRSNHSELIELRDMGKVNGIGNFTWGSYNIFFADAILPDWFFLDAKKNYTGSTQLDTILRKARFAVGYYQREEMYSKAINIIMDEVYWMPCFIVNRLYGKKKNVQLTVGVDEVPRFQDAYFIQN